MAMALMKSLEEYQEKRMDEFHKAYAQLRQDLVDDLAKKYREAGIPVTFKYTTGRASLQGKIVGEEAFIEALVAGDETEIASALNAMLMAFVATRNYNAAQSDTSKDET